MVRIIEKSPGEIKREDRISKLVKIAKDVYPKAKISPNPIYIQLGFGTNSDVDMMVFSDNNMIYVYRKIYLEQAVKLAGAYERS